MREVLVKDDLDVVSGQSIVTLVAAVAMTSGTVGLAIVLYVQKRKKYR